MKERESVCVREKESLDERGGGGRKNEFDEHTIFNQRRSERARKRGMSVQEMMNFAMYFTI